MSRRRECEKLNRPLEPGLALTLRFGDDVLIGDTITVTLAQVGDRRVRLHIAAPREIRILRGSVARRMQQQPAPAA